MKRRGQFYLLGAIVIISIIIGFAVISNYSKKKQTPLIYDLKDELGIEGVNVIEYGTYNELGPNFANLTLHFSGVYSSFAGDKKNMYFIVGTGNNITMYSFTDVVQGTYSIDVGGGYSKIDIKNKEFKENKIIPTSKKITVNVEGKDYEFDITPGENFYFIITQKINGEKYVITS